MYKLIICILIFLSVFVQAQREKFPGFKGFPHFSSPLGFGATIITNGNYINFTMLDDANVLGHWIFDDVYHTAETGDALTVDQSGNSNTLTAENFSANFADELTGTNPAYDGGNALKFNGVDEGFVINDPAADPFNLGTGDFTIECWVEVGDVSAASRFYITGKGENSGITKKSWAIWITEADKLRVSITDGTADFVNFSTADSYTEGTVIFIAIAADRDGDQKLYINGVQTNTQTVTNAVDITNAIELLISRDRGGGQVFWNGIISEVRYSNSYRTAQEIKESYAIGKSWRTSSGAITGTNQSFSQRFTNSASSTDLMQQVVTTVANTMYNFTFDAYRVSGSGNLTVELSGAHTKTLIFTNTANQNQSYEFTATTTSLTIKIYGTIAGDVYQVDNFLLRAKN